MIRIATWNVNSLKVRLQHLADWLQGTRPDIVALQETKTVDSLFPAQELAAIGYRSIAHGQKTYNGVALLYRDATVTDATDIVRGIPGFADPQARFLAATLHTAQGAVRVLDGYFPNGAEVGCDKYHYKLEWIAALAESLPATLADHPHTVLLGDFNIAPEDRDVWDPQGWEGNIAVSEPERAAYRNLVSLGMQDVFRLFDQPEKTFSWWDYRMLGFPRNHGLRIDSILASDALARRCRACSVDKAPRKLAKPSDHAPMVADFELG